MLPDTTGRINCRHDNRAYLPTDSICQDPGANARAGSANREAQLRQSSRSGSSGMRQNLSQSDAPRFDVLINPPDLTPWLSGDRGIPGVITRESGRPGPHVALLSLMHGNEFAGAIVLDRLLREDLMPVRGTLSFVFVN